MSNQQRPQWTNAIRLASPPALAAGGNSPKRSDIYFTSECTLRGFTCSQVNVDPKFATPAEIAKMRALAIGHQIDGLTGGLVAK